jgi:phosphonate transport system substrate-binding protein
LFRIIILVTFLLSFVVAKDKVYRFAPLPTKNIIQNIKDFLPLSAYFEENYNIKVKFVKYKNYNDILEGFKKGKIDIAYLGPLPLVSLYKKYKYVKPIVVVKQKNGLSKYRCVLAKFKEDNIDFSKQIKVALTQPLSTCGYYMSSKLLKKEFDIDLKKQKYNYLMSHTNALLSVVKGEYDIAGAKEDIAKKFESLGMEVIAKSDLLPGFSIVANTKTLTKEEIAKLREILLNIPQEKLYKMGGLVSKGFDKIDIDEYKAIEVDIQIPQKGNM